MTSGAKDATVTSAGTDAADATVVTAAETSGATVVTAAETSGANVVTAAETSGANDVAAAMTSGGIESRALADGLAATAVTRATVTGPRMTVKR